MPLNRRHRSQEKMARSEHKDVEARAPSHKSSPPTASTLQSIIQDLEAANEELQSANEEILSSNEELQSTNEELDTAREELQSTNEEIITVNEELHGRNEDLARVNSDLVNLLGSVQIAIVMVDGDFRIRRFTPMAEKILNLIPTDIGRPISHIKPNIDCPISRSDPGALDKMVMQSARVQDLHGRGIRSRSGPTRTSTTGSTAQSSSSSTSTVKNAKKNTMTPLSGGYCGTRLLSCTHSPARTKAGRGHSPTNDSRLLRRRHGHDEPVGGNAGHSAAHDNATSQRRTTDRQARLRWPRCSKSSAA